MKLTFLYCEGPHDMAFLAKLIKDLDLTNNEVNTVSDLHETIKNIVLGAIEKIDSESIRIDKPLRVFFPNKVFALKNDHYVCIFSMGGKDNLEAALQNIVTNKLLLKYPKVSKVDLLRHAFVLDADYKHLEDGKPNPQGGIINTLSNLSREIQGYVNEFEEFTNHANWHDTSFGQIGNFIFYDSTEEEGTLEDLLEQFVKDSAEPMLEPSNHFCSSVKTFDIDRKAKAKDKTKQQKIVFTSMTQVFHPGCSLAVGLQNDKVIDSEKIKTHKISKEFEDFLTI
ncbi:DUF3226 domain-containing protein [Vibrio alginolyticus]|uniref:DUF3226 domain-containing protein n=1 Tax=Vibrio alginolyticus TaxID=663 RepID=UPI001BD4DFF8|nr:DUF3226 domain-containing protein [Vibrio alginolyticus]MBT0011457.1 hypothetical protein [Vibrio alginolyticus]MBT0038734.1 hypothetical protein [Vibrio alginolyticus]